jgi:ABC-2 type transport system permease protein
MHLLLLTKTALRNQFGLNRFFKGGQSRWLKFGLGALVVGLGAAVAFVWLFQYSWLLGGALEKFGFLHLLIMQAIVYPSLVCFFTGLYSVPGQLFFCRDYDLLLSLPVRTSAVVMSKLAGLLLSNCVYTAFLALPPLIVYGWKSGAGPAFYLFALAALPFIPLVPLTLAALFASITGRFAARFKRSNQVLINLVLILLAGLMMGYFELSKSNRLATAGVNTVLDAIKTWYPPARLCFDALKDQSIFSLLGFMALSGGLFVLFCAVFGQFFRAILSGLTATAAKANYKLTELTASSPLRALYLKELKGYVSCPIYILNTFFGMVMLTLFSASTVCLSDATRAKLIQTFGAGAVAPAVAIVVTVGCTLISCTTAVTISLEGRNLWILKTAPVDPLTIFKSKLLLNLSTTWPLIAINSVMLAVGLRLDLRHWLLVWGVPSVSALFIAVAGLLVNLLFPKLEFKSPTVVVKQSASALIAFLVEFASIALPVFLYVWLPPARVSYEAYAALVAAGLLLITALLWQALRTRGVRWFEQLH